VAELTVGYLFALARQIPQMTTSMKDGQWEKKGFGKGVELEGKTLGLIGCGRIGSLVARKAIFLDMEVIFHCLPPFPDLPGAHNVSLDELLRRADFISLHVPYTEETHFILCQEEFAKMKDGVYVINCGRGGTVNEDALYDAIVSGKVAGAALDVFHDEKEERGKRLMELPQVIGSPHVGAGTVEAKKRVGEEVAQIVVEFTRR
jgi:D-3-phosphoglycerate dehydrogenase